MVWQFILRSIPLHKYRRKYNFFEKTKKDTQPCDVVAARNKKPGGYPGFEIFTLSVSRRPYLHQKHLSGRIPVFSRHA